MERPPRVRYLSASDARRYSVSIESFPCFHVSGSIIGMRNQFYGKDALLVRSGSYIYNVSSRPEIYYMAH